MGQSQEQVVKSMELFAREVMPRVRDLERRNVRAHA
jgi:hypothetical protein